MPLFPKPNAGDAAGLLGGPAPLGASFPGTSSRHASGPHLHLPPERQALFLVGEGEVDHQVQPAREGVVDVRAQVGG
ncbi:hypothetical protein ACFWEO_37885, partial [Streptomyces roseolus]|uniref:hypothetical protein n=1 Tax=Streptomyces roseolus TaxID=67358 RepID=UPI003661A275